MITPDSVRTLPVGSVLIAPAWAAIRPKEETRRTQCWQVTGRSRRMDDSEMVNLVARTLAVGEGPISLARHGDGIPEGDTDDMAVIKSEVGGVLEEILTGMTYGMPPTIARGVERTYRRRFADRYPRLGRLLTD